MTEPRIYIADLAAYNAGHLHGVWIDACNDLDDIWSEIKAMLSSSPVADSEEYSIHDYEGFEGYQVSEYEGIENVRNVACFIEEYPDFGGELLSYYSDLDEAQNMAENNYYGCFSSVADYVQELTEQTSEIPQHLEFYIDYERMGRDMEMSGDIFTVTTANDEVHIFFNH